MFESMDQAEQHALQADGWRDEEREQAYDPARILAEAETDEIFWLIAQQQFFEELHYRQAA